MNRLHTRLYQTYDQHYAPGEALGAATDATCLNYDSQFGQLLKRAPEGSYLDVGCGSGHLLGWLRGRLPNASLEGVDASQVMVDLAHRRLAGAAAVACGDGVAAMAARPQSYDGIFATDILEHMGDDYLADFLDAARQALRPQGFFAVNVPNMVNLSSTELRYRDATHLQGFTEKSMRQCLHAFGFTGIRCYGTVPTSWGQRARLLVEGLAHRVVFRVCGHADVTVFTRNLTGVGFRAA